MKMSRHRSEEALTLTIAVLLVGVVAIGIIAGKLAKCSGADVRKRFLEVTPDYTAEGLRNWVMHYPSQARRYAFPVLFPLDLLFSTTLAGFLAVASIAACQTLHWARGWLWVFAIFPVLYGVCDIVENILLARLMFRPTTVTDGSVALAQTVTRLKFTAVTIGVLQLIVLLVSWLLGTLVHELR